MPFSLKDYGLEWPAVRARVLAKEGHRCGKCGLRNYSVIERQDDGSFILWQETDSYKEAKIVAAEATQQTKRKHVVIVLAIAHLTDPDPQNCSDENLGARCSYDHFKLDNYLHSVRQRQTWKKKRGETPAVRNTVSDLFEDAYAKKDDDGDPYFKQFFYR